MHFDDNEYVYANPHVITGITPKNIAWAFTAFHSNNWHPVTWISHMADCQIYGLNPGMHHLTNLFFHIANSILLFLILLRMTGCLWKSAFVAALFALHPMHVESVAWISERKDVLSMFFWMLAIWSYARFVRMKTPGSYIPVFLFFLLALMSKPMVVTLPFVLLLIDYWPLGRLSGFFPAISRTKAISGLVFEKLPLFFLIPVSCVLTFYAQKHGGVVKSLETFSLPLRLENALVSYVMYLVKLVFPVRLAFLYPHPAAFPAWEPWTAFLFLAVVSIAAIIFFKKMPYFITGWFWFLGTLVPVIGVVQVGMQAMADRYVYIPSIGIFMIVAWAVPALFTNCPRIKMMIPAAAVVVISIFSILSWRQAGFWHDTISLFQHTIDVTSDNYIAHDSLGVEFFMQRRIDDAISEYQKSLAIRPDYYYSHFNLGAAYYSAGKIDRAIREYEAAIQSEPMFVKAMSNLGAAFFAKGMVKDAIREYRSSINIDPGYVDARFNMAVALDSIGRFDDAISQYLTVIHIRPELFAAHFRVAMDFYRQGNMGGAVKYFASALRLKPDFTRAHFFLGLAFYKQNRMDEAKKHYMEALRLRPDFAEAFNNLGAVYLRQRKIDKAIASFKKALEINRNYVSAGNNLKKAYAMKKGIWK